MNKNKIILISAIAAILIIILILFITNNGSDTVSSNREAPDKNILVGDWLRTSKTNKCWKLQLGRELW
jgi:hypothetical protein